MSEFEQEIIYEDAVQAQAERIAVIDEQLTVMLKAVSTLSTEVYGQRENLELCLAELKHMVCESVQEAVAHEVENMKWTSGCHTPSDVGVDHTHEIEDAMVL